MMYVYYTEGLDEEITKKITDNGSAVRIDPDEDMYLLSKVDKIYIDGSVIDSSYPLEEYIKFFDDGGIVRLAGIEITKLETIKTFLDMLYELCVNENNETYAERIYNSINPRNEIMQIINEFLKVRMDILLSKVKSERIRIEKRIEYGILEWE